MWGHGHSYWWAVLCTVLSMDGVCQEMLWRHSLTDICSSELKS